MRNENSHVEHKKHKIAENVSPHNFKNDMTGPRGYKNIFFLFFYCRHDFSKFFGAKFKFRNAFEIFKIQ